MSVILSRAPVTLKITSTGKHWRPKLLRLILCNLQHPAWSWSPSCVFQDNEQELALIAHSHSFSGQQIMSIMVPCLTRVRANLSARTWASTRLLTLAVYRPSERIRSSPMRTMQLPRELLLKAKWRAFSWSWWLISCRFQITLTVIRISLHFSESSSAMHGTCLSITWALEVFCLPHNGNASIRSTSAVQAAQVLSSLPIPGGTAPWDTKMDAQLQSDLISLAVLSCCAYLSCRV